MVAVPLKIKVSVGRLSVYLVFQVTTLVWHHHCIEEWHGSVWSGFFYSDLDDWFYCIDVVEEFTLV